MSKDREAARALNSLARDGLALLGTSDSSALTDFLHEFFAGDDPGNESPVKTLCHTLPNAYTDELEDDEAFEFDDINGISHTNNNSTVYMHAGVCSNGVIAIFIKNPICRVFS